MPLGDVTYQNAALDAVVASWPTSGAHYALFDGDPTNGGVELSGGGYTPPAFAAANWSAATGGAKDVTAPLSFGTSTDAYASVGTHWGVKDAAGLLAYWDDLSDAQVVEVDAAGAAVTISPTLLFEDGE